MLVPAVLRPEEREDRQLEVVGLALEQLDDARVLGVGEAERLVERVFRDPRQVPESSRLTGGFQRQGSSIALDDCSLDGRVSKAHATSMVGAASRRLTGRVQSTFGET
jgi:hypothetical protein